MDFLVGVLVVAVGLIVSIALHEVGHLVPAKLFKVKVSQYFVGFGKTLWSTRRGGTEYGVKMLPLGGYVRMIGMFPPATDTRSDDARTEDRIRRTGLRGMAASVIEDTRAASTAELAEELHPGDGHKAFYEL
ncbi:MAG TPA: site-2 protease family protein, partial [Candidatus Ruania gallistercoris]|nr:site-2 protease family protein [Candidatus Ruania gallistercoris]